MPEPTAGVHGAVRSCSTRCSVSYCREKIVIAIHRGKLHPVAVEADSAVDGSVAGVAAGVADMKDVVRRLVADDERAVLLPQPEPESARYVSNVAPQFVLSGSGQIVEAVVSKPVVAVRVADTK